MPIHIFMFWYDLSCNGLPTHQKKGTNGIMFDTTQTHGSEFTFYRDSLAPLLWSSALSCVVLAMNCSLIKTTVFFLKRVFYENTS